MKKDQESFPQFKAVICDVINYCESISYVSSLWELEERGFLFKMFQTRKSSDDLLSKFFIKVELVIDVRRQLLTAYNYNIEKPEGSFLIFDPSATMYDGLSEEVSSGFFDSDDVPPPEFWIGVVDDRLISYIPPKYFEFADLGINNCMSGCLEWSDN